MEGAARQPVRDGEVDRYGNGIPIQIPVFGTKYRALIRSLFDNAVPLFYLYIINV